MSTGRCVPLVPLEPRLVVAGEDQDIRGCALTGQVPVVVDVVGRQQRGDLGRPQLGDLGDLRPAPRCVRQPVAPMRLEAADGTDRDPRSMVVYRAQATLLPVDDGQARTAVGRVDAEEAVAVAEPAGPRGDVVEIGGELRDPLSPIYSPRRFRR